MKKQYFAQVVGSEKDASNAVSCMIELGKSVGASNLILCYTSPIEWENYFSDVAELSVKHPNVTIQISVLCGNANIASNYTRDYFRGNKYYQDSGIVSFPDFDENELN